MSDSTSYLAILTIGFALLLSACGNREPERAAEQTEKSVAADKAEIGEELAAQLEAMGYLKKGGKGAAVRYSQEKLAQALDCRDCTFVMHDLARGVHVRHNAERAAKRFSPCSTFKIPNTLIALETGVLDGPEAEIPWDRKRDPEQPFWKDVLEPRGIHWARDHTLESAFENSCVWFYREVARRIGDQRMSRYLDVFDYGNMDTSSGIDLFWLSASLEISADEQVRFLDRLARRQLELEAATYDAAAVVFEVERTDTYALYAKTGSGHGEQSGLGWYVGYVTRGDDVYTFAFNMTADSETVWKKRVPLARAALLALGVI
jgi:beta-lactamase class D